MFRKNTASQFLHVQMNKTADGTPLTGATVTVRRCIDGTFAAATGTVTEDTGAGSAPGWYKFAMSQADTNGNDIGFQFLATSGISVSLTIVTTAGNPTDAVRFGLTSLPNAAADAAGGLPISDAGGLDMDSIKADTAAILIDTAEIGAAGAGLNAIPIVPANVTKVNGFTVTGTGQAGNPWGPA